VRKKLLIGVVVLLVAIQFWPIDRTPPPVTGEIEAPPEVMAILETSCFDCHSSETIWPWYSRIAPVSIWIARHVEQGRGDLDLSNWADYSPDRADHKLEELMEMVEAGEMPLPSYLILHRDARLTPEQSDVLLRWAEEARAELR
jgi:hypothetical protein